MGVLTLSERIRSWARQRIHAQLLLSALRSSFLWIDQGVNGRSRSGPKDESSRPHHRRRVRGKLFHLR